MQYYDELAVVRGDSFHEEPLALVFDDNEGYAMKCYSYLCKVRSRVTSAKRRIQSVCFANDQQYYPLQAADILAYATCNELKKNESNQWSEKNIFSDLLKAEDSAFGLLYRGELFHKAEDDEILGVLIAEMVQQ